VRLDHLLSRESEDWQCPVPIPRSVGLGRGVSCDAGETKDRGGYSQPELLDALVSTFQLSGPPDSYVYNYITLLLQFCREQQEHDREEDGRGGGRGKRNNEARTYVRGE
jgi:hypothetical protein